MSCVHATLRDAEALLRRHWGYPALRSAQRRAVVAALRGRDVLALLPTGAGKSLCFQIPGILAAGIAVVVSPLISLMQDQVGALQRRGIAAAMLSSSQSGPARETVLQGLQAGTVKMLYVAPERIASLISLLNRVGVGLLAVDEAHCVSEWGHDFRPHYRALGYHRMRLGRPPVLAVTATATADTRADIESVLRLERPVRVTTTFDRPNLVFGVTEFADEPGRVRAARDLLLEIHGSAILYVPTRNRADGLAAALRRFGIAAVPYHAGLPGPERKAILDDFMTGKARVVTATNAFGMGIDYADVRAVVHLGVPLRPEAYYQEAGRAGRDGRRARCELFWRKADLALARRLVRPDSEGAQRGLDGMVRYVRTGRCRRRVLLDYFGERLRSCTGCDRCGRSR